MIGQAGEDISAILAEEAPAAPEQPQPEAPAKADTAGKEKPEAAAPAAKEGAK